MHLRIPACLIILILAAYPASAGIILSDDFNDNSLNTSLWSVVIGAAGATVIEDHQRLEVTLTGDNEGAGVTLRWLAPGNFDFQASFAMLTNIDTFTTDQDESGAGLFAFGGNGILAARFPVSVADLPPPRGLYVGGDGDTTAFGYAFTSDQSGKLRITRVGNLYSTYYWGSGAWIELGSGTSAWTGPADLSLSAFADGGAMVSVAFDDFRLEADTPEPGSLALAVIALGLIWGIGKRR